jgi:hypothetical protein
MDGRVLWQNVRDCSGSANDATTHMDHRKKDIQFRYSVPKHWVVDEKTMANMPMIALQKKNSEEWMRSQETAGRPGRDAKGRVPRRVDSGSIPRCSCHHFNLDDHPRKEISAVYKLGTRDNMSSKGKARAEHDQDHQQEGPYRRVSLICQMPWLTSPKKRKGLLRDRQRATSVLD